MGEIGKLRHKPTKLKIKLKSSHSKKYSNLELLGEGQSQLHKQNTFFPLALLRLLFSCPVVSDSETSWTAAPRLSCPSPSPRVCSNSYPLSQWCHPNIFSSVVPFYCLQSFPASGSLPMSQLFASGGLSIGASASVLPMNIQGWSPLRLTGWISFLSKGLSRVFSNTTVQKRQFFGTQPFLLASCHTHPYLTTGKTISWTIQTFVGKVMSLLFNTLSRFVMAFLPRSNRLLISWLQSPSTVLLEPKKRKSVTASTSSLSVCHEVMGLMPWSQFFLILSFKPAFSCSSFTLLKRLFSSSLLSAIRVVLSAFLRLLIFLLAILIPACASSNPVFHRCTLHIS